MAVLNPARFDAQGGFFTQGFRMCVFSFPVKENEGIVFFHFDHNHIYPTNQL